MSGFGSSRYTLASTVCQDPVGDLVEVRRFNAGGRHRPSRGHDPAVFIGRHPRQRWRRQGLSFVALPLLGHGELADLRVSVWPGDEGVAALERGDRLVVPLEHKDVVPYVDTIRTPHMPGDRDLATVDVSAVVCSRGREPQCARFDA